MSLDEQTARLLPPRLSLGCMRPPVAVFMSAVRSSSDSNDSSDSAGPAYGD